MSIEEHNDSFDEDTNTYIIDVRQGRETARLLEQGRMLTAISGGPLPADFDISSVTKILDIACGPGEWALEIARALPKIEVIGIDIDKKHINYATAQANIQRLHNLKFFEMNVQHSLSFFFNNSFDFINARFLVGFMRPQDWATLLSECYRLLRPGGKIRWMECDMEITTSPSYEYFKRLLSRALWIARQSCSVDGFHLGITPLMPHMLRTAGFHQVNLESFVFETSYATRFHEAAVLNIKIALSLLHPFLIQQNVIDENAFQELASNTLKEINDPSYRACGTLFSAWGQKPLNSSQKSE